MSRKDIGIGPARPLTTASETDLSMMRRALLAAKDAAERGEVPVGAVVARGREILAVAANEREATGDPTAHAELLVVRKAARTLGSWRLAGCTLYATLEPCPMCAGAAHAARLLRLVYAAPDPKAGYAGTLHNTPADDRSTTPRRRRRRTRSRGRPVCFATSSKTAAYAAKSPRKRLLKAAKIGFSM
jgi:tRNA(adenine34) deaminase